MWIAEVTVIVAPQSWKREMALVDRTTSASHVCIVLRWSYHIVNPIGDRQRLPCSLLAARTAACLERQTVSSHHLKRTFSKTWSRGEAFVSKPQSRTLQHGNDSVRLCALRITARVCNFLIIFSRKNEIILKQDSHLYYTSLLVPCLWQV